MMTIEVSLLDTITGGAGSLVNIEAADRFAAYNECAATARARGEKSAGAAHFFHKIDPTGITGKELNKQGDLRVAQECGWMKSSR